MFKRRFLALDSLRGICALLVAIHNLNFGPWLPQLPFTAHSWLFVDFFFVLSGFIVTYAYASNLANIRELGGFMLRRAGRLWPLHAAMLALLVGGSLLRSLGTSALHSSLGPLLGTEIRAIVANLLMLQTFDIPSRLSWNAPSWSISTEFWTYLLFGAISVLFARRRPPVSFILGIVLASGAALVFLSPAYLATNTNYAFLRCVYGFFSGHLVYRAYEAVSLDRWGGLAELMTFVLVVGFVLTTGSDASSMTAPLIFGFAIWVFAQETGSLSKLLRKRPCVLLGTWSYSIYMVHWFVRNILVRANPLLGTANHGWALGVLLIVYLVIVVALAATTYRLIEQPARQAINRIAEAMATIPREKSQPL